MLITRYNPNREFGEFKRSFNLLNSMLDELTSDSSSSFNTAFTPAINTREGEYAYHVEIDLPGMKKDEINIQVEDNSLVISGERKIKKDMKEENYYKIESSFGTFSRTFSLPENVDVENIHAESKNGVLEIVIPKLHKEKIDKVKKISIK